MTAASYRFSVYCHICKERSPWGDHDHAQTWQSDHFDEEHPDNPMVKANSAIQRYPEDEVPDDG